MRRWLRWLAALPLLVAVLPALSALRAQHCLAAANAPIEAALLGRLRGAAAVAAVRAALPALACAEAGLPRDPRVPLLRALAHLLLQEPERAEAVLRAAIAEGERPELVLNLGRARAAQGDEAAAQAAFLRAAWAAPAVTDTLPAALRHALADAVAARAAALGSEVPPGIPPLPP
jgi:hypothetical protein